jgi:hypothetical protein
MRVTTFHPGKLCLFAGLSLLDLILTWKLVQSSEGQVYESNPVANWWLGRYGWPGLAAFKLAAVLLVVLLAAVVTRYRPRTGNRVLTFACSSVAVVVLYSSFLVGFLKIQPEAAQSPRLHMAKKESQRLDSQLYQTRTFRAMRDRLGSDLIARRCTFPEAVAQLVQAEKGQNTTTWLATLRKHYPGYSVEECLAANLLTMCLVSLAHDPLLAEQVEQRLRADFQACFGRQVPAPSANPSPRSQPKDHSRRPDMASHR